MKENGPESGYVNTPLFCSIDFCETITRDS